MRDVMDLGPLRDPASSIDLHPVSAFRCAEDAAAAVLCAAEAGRT
jgi:hypothetical protein